MKLEHILIQNTKINSKWFKDLSKRPEIVKLLEENTGRTIPNINHVFFLKTTEFLGSVPFLFSTYLENGHYFCKYVFFFSLLISFWYVFLIFGIVSQPILFILLKVFSLCASF